MADSYHVQLGFWTDWSQGPVFGRMLTVAQSDANLLIAFVAFFVALVGTRFWRLACFVLHVFVYSSKTQRDALHHQRQALLRNVSNAEAGLSTLFRLAWAWKHSGRGWLRVLPLLGFTILCVGGWAVATGFSAKVATLTEVLISGEGCGFLNVNLNSNMTETETFLNPHVSRLIQASSTYAKQCYSANSSFGALGCNTFVQKSLPLNITTDAGCPFHPSICKSQKSNIRHDTGLLDTHVHFGLNAPMNQRVQYRRVLQCAPIVTQGFSTSHNFSGDRSYTRYWYGAVESATGTPVTNFTRQFSNDALFESKMAVTDPNAAYIITSNEAWFNNGSFVPGRSTIRPIPQLWRTDGDLSLLFLVTNGVAYVAANNDPWYNASTVVGLVNGIDSETPGQTAIYYPDEPASPLMCIEQHQFCFPSLPQDSRCTPLAGTDDAYSAAVSLLRHNEAAAYRFVWIYSIALGNDLGLRAVIDGLGPEALAARDSLLSGTQGPLPDNQWQLEVQHWHEIYLAMMQQSFVSAATGPLNPQVERWLQRPNTTDERTLCSSQKILSNAFASFSVFGLAFIFAFGGLIIIASYTLPDCLSRLRQRFGIEYEDLEWSTNEIFQLQRLAHEELGFGTWSRADQFIPITKPNESLAMLDLSDPCHPRLLAPPDLTRTDSFEKARHFYQSYRRSALNPSNDHSYLASPTVSVSTVSAEHGSPPEGGSVEMLSRDERGGYERVTDRYGYAI